MRNEQLTSSQCLNPTHWSWSLTGQEAGGGEEEQGDQRLGRRHLGRLSPNTGLYRVFFTYPKINLFFVVFTAYLFEIRVPLCEFFSPALSVFTLWLLLSPSV